MAADISNTGTLRGITAEHIGKYDVIERIGRGGMGTVYKARDPRLNRHVAIKVISPDIEITDELRRRFISEAQACAGLRHPNIVTIYDVGEEGERVFIVMELLDGQELKRLIADGVELDIEEKVGVMIQLCDALHYAHRQGIIHRDIKPGNVIVQRDGSVKVIDFGIAKMAASASATRTGLIMGTIKYMSPEQVRGQADARSDQYSIAAVSYEMLTMRPPVLGDDPFELLEQLRSEKIPHVRELNPSVPVEVAAIVERAMGKEASDRYPDLGQMRRELEGVERHLMGQADSQRRELISRLPEFRELESVYLKSVGGTGREKIPPGAELTMRLESLQKWNQHFDERLAELRRKIVRADELKPEVEHADRHLQAGQFAEAIARCEAVLQDLPEHGSAQTILEKARSVEEADRREILAQKLIDDARDSLQDGDAPLCLSILEQVAEIRPSEELAATMEELRDIARAMHEEVLANDRTRIQVLPARESSRGIAGFLGSAQRGWLVGGTAAILVLALVLFRMSTLSRTRVGGPPRLSPSFRTGVESNQKPIEVNSDEVARKATEEQDAAGSAAAEQKARAEEAARVATEEQKTRDEEAARKADAEAVAQRKADDEAATRRAAETKARAEAEAKARVESAASNARSSMTAARSAAARNRAASHAPDQWARAESEEAQAAAALNRSDYQQAQRLYEASAGNYRTAAKMADSKIESLEHELDQAIEEATTRRRDAMASGAGQLASDPFGKGSAKQAEALRLARDKKLSEAIAAQRAAGDWFVRAKIDAEKQAPPQPPPRAAKPKYEPPVPAF